jgi:hypothetical protein
MRSDIVVDMPTFWAGCTGIGHGVSRSLDPTGIPYLPAITGGQSACSIWTGPCLAQRNRPRAIRP